MVPSLQPNSFPGKSSLSSEKKNKSSDRVLDVSQKALPKNEPSTKKFKARCIDSLSGFFKSIRSLFKHLCCCGGLDKENSPSVSEVSQSISITESESDTTLEQTSCPPLAVKPSVKSPIPINTKDPAFILDKMLIERKLAEKELAVFALEMEKYRAEHPQDPNFLPRPQKNLGQTCYMNAALQCLDASHGLKHSHCQKLINGSLVRPDEISLLDFENQTLYYWSPVEVDTNALLEKQKDLLSKISVLEDTNLERLVHLKGALKNVEKQIQDEINFNNKRKLLAAKLTELESAENKVKDVLNKEILDLNFAVLEKHDRVLFKWSYLLLLQAKRYGSNTQITKALELHHNVCFTIARGDLKDRKGHYGDRITHLKSTRKVAHDAASYLDLWHDMLGKQLESTRYKEFIHNETLFIDHIKADPIGVVLLHTTGDKDNFMSCVSSYFDTEEHLESGFDASANGNPVKVNDYIDHRRINQVPPKFLTFSLKKIDFVANKKVELKQSIPFSNNPEGSYNESLILDKYFFNKKVRYRLVSCTEHTGTDNSGHYIAYVLGKDKNWYRCSDSDVRQIPHEAIPFRNARTFTYALLKKNKS